ncbi:hypothetical protein AGMMS49944_16080 [Spirochaetia bacterium]|nr:hypothetical protein AGMMS49944_16080 [Spirochaetia bacterium]
MTDTEKNYFGKLFEGFSKPEQIKNVLDLMVTANAGIPQDLLNSLEICGFELIEHIKQEMKRKEGIEYNEYDWRCDNARDAIALVDESIEVIRRYWTVFNREVK